MKALLKMAIVAGAAGAVVNMLLKKQRANRELAGGAESVTGASGMTGGDEASYGQDPGQSVSGGDMSPDTNMVTGGDPQREQRGSQPQDWRGAQNVLE